MSRFDYIFAHRYSPVMDLTKYDRRVKMKAKDRRKKAEVRGFLGLLAVLSVLVIVNGVAIHYADKASQEQLHHAYQLLGH